MEEKKLNSLLYSRIFRMVSCLIIISFSAQLTIDVGDIPITGQTLSILAVALLLKPIDAFLTILIYLILGAVGLPIYADGAKGFSIITGGSGGFLIGFLIAGTTISYLHKKISSKSLLTILGLTALGSILILVFGNIRLIYMYGVKNGLEYGFFPFWKGAAIKVIIGSFFVFYFEQVFGKARK